MGFVLMVRKGNKQQYKTFEADVNSELAQNLRDQELAQKEEKERVKRLTLNITERFEEEDYQEMMQQQQRPVTQNLNRERKKYQHPKGAPDADLIFGPKRVRWGTADGRKGPVENGLEMGDKNENGGDFCQIENESLCHCKEVVVIKKKNWFF